MKKKKTIILLILLSVPVAPLAFLLWNINYLSNAGPKAKASWCKGNLNQLAVAFQMYRDDYGGPPESGGALFQWSGLDPVYVRCPFVPREEEHGFIIRMDLFRSNGESEDIIAHCPKAHPTHGEHQHRFSYIKAQRSILKRDLSTETISEEDFQRKLSAQTKTKVHNKLGLEDRHAPTPGP